MEYRTKYRDWMQKYFAAHADEKVRARDVYEKMTAEGLSINLATVYRNLDRLEKENVLKGHKTAGEDEKFYQYMRPKMDCEDGLREPSAPSVQPLRKDHPLKLRVHERDLAAPDGRTRLCDRLRPVDAGRPLPGVPDGAL